MTDFKNRTPGLSSPARNAAAVTPSDESDLAVDSRALIVGVAGDVKVTMMGGDVVTLPLLAGVIYPLQVRQVHATGTTATGITALW